MQTNRPFYRRLWFIIPIAVIIILVSAMGLYVHLSYLTALEIPDTPLSAFLPVIEDEYGKVDVNTENCLVLELRAITKAELKDFVKLCKASAFRTPECNQDTCYVATNAEGYTLSVNYCPGEWRMYVSVWTPDFLKDVTYENLRGENAVNSVIIENLSLPSEDRNGEKITWKSSDTDVISDEGVVSRPKSGVGVVNMTATVTATNEKKTFTFRVPGYDYNDGTLIVLNDLNPAAGVGISAEDPLFTWDTTNNSVIADLGKVKKINYAAMQDDDGISRVVPAYTSLWVSNDNVSYTRVRDFKMILRDGVWYLHDFETTARYVKVHYGSYEVEETNFIGGLGEMIRAGYEENFGSNSAKFTTTEYVLKNETGKDTKDYAWRISKADLGITTSNDDSIRVYVDGKLQYFYVDVNDVVVRIKDLAKDASVTLTVMQSKSANIMSLADKESVYEVTYGTKEIWSGSIAKEGRNIISFPAGTKWPDGSVLKEDTLFSSGGSSWVKSTDGGYSWQVVGAIINNADPGKEPVKSPYFPRGYIVDKVTNRIFYHSFVILDGDIDLGGGHSTNPIYTCIIYSDNGGVTWNMTRPADKSKQYLEASLPFSTDPADSLANTQVYGEGLTLSTHDGYGPNVDLVIAVGCAPFRDVPNVDTFGCVRVAYSTDMGETWHMSSKVYREAPATEEGGAGESTIMEREDGVLVMFMKYTNGAIDYGYFAVSYSNDQGRTWQYRADATDVYAPATQPVLEVMNINGVDVQTLSYGGNNSLGSRKYVRGPLVYANTTNGETFRNYKNLGFRSTQEILYLTRMMFVTNHSAERLPNGDFRAGWSNNQVSYFFYMTDFDDWYTRTKGAYDSFENGIAKYEGWFALSGDIQTSYDYATDGSASMHLERIYQVGRNIPYLQDGKVTMNIYASEKTRFVLELQTAYTDKEGTAAAPLGIEVERNKITFQNSDQDTGLALTPGWNTLTFELKLTENRATFQLNDGEAVDFPINPDATHNGVCYVAIMGKSEIYMDEFMVESYLEPTLTAAEGDQEAADAVVEMIKAMGTDKAKIEAARAAFDKLNQVQKDFVNRKEYVSGEWINYYDVLIEAEG